MSEVTTLNSNVRPSYYSVGGERQTSPDTTRQAAKEGGNSLPPSVSLEPVKPRETTPIEKAEARADNVQQAVAQMNEYIQTTQRDLRFSIDEESGETVVKVLDRQTEEVIRQIPDEIFLRLARNLNVDEPVHFFSEQA